MATHFICQSTEPLPHTYPTGLGQKTHGAVSQYEVYNDANKPHTQFPYPGWDFSQTSDEDSLPLIQPLPKPEWKNSRVQPDPTLCVTPIKQQELSKLSVFKKHTVDPDPLLCVTPDKSEGHGQKVVDQRSNDIQGDDSQTVYKDKKVRFDIEEKDESMCYMADGSYLDPTISRNLDSFFTKKLSPNKPYKPELYGDDDGDMNEVSDMPKNSGKVEVQDSTGNARTVRYTVGQVNNQAVYIPLTSNLDTDKTDNSESKTIKEPSVATETGNKTSTKRDVIPKQTCSKSKTIKIVREKQQDSDPKPQETDPIAACKSNIDPSKPKRRVKVLRENQYGPKLNDYNYPFDQNPLDKGGDEHMFARPEYNSTLRMKMEADKLRQSEIDVETALNRKLKLSEATKSGISEKAASMVNAETGFSGLVSLEVPVDKLCGQAAELKTARAKQVKAPKSEQEQREPDMMEFFTPELQRETVTYTMPNVPAPSEQLSSVSHWRAFDLYRHNRVWEGRSFSYKRK